MAFGTDYTPVGPMPTDIVLGDVDATSMRLARDIRDKGHGIDTREAMARMILKSSTMHNHLIKVNNALRVQNDEYYRQFTDVMKELSEDKDYHSLPEIAVARGGHDTLGERLNETASNLEIEKQRINNIMDMPQGSTTGDAQLSDMKIGADGKLYDTPGDAVRLNDLKNAEKVGRLENDYYNNFPLLNEFENSDFKDGTAGWNPFRASLSVHDDVLRATGDGNSGVIQISQNLPTLGVHRYHKLFVRVIGEGAQYIGGMFNSDGTTEEVLVDLPESGKWYEVDAVRYWRVFGNYNNLSVRVRFPDNTMQSGNHLEIRKPVAIDLTATFDAPTPSSSTPLPDIHKIRDLLSRYNEGYFGEKTNMYTTKEIYNMLRREVDEVKRDIAELPEGVTTDVFAHWVPKDKPVVDTGISYIDFIDMYENLRTSYPNIIERTFLTNDSSNTYPIYAYTFTPEHYSKTVFITAGHHGDEFEAYWSVFNFMKHWTESFDSHERMKYARGNIRYIVIPIVNPWGVVNFTRRNSNNIDPNRNYDVLWGGAMSMGSEPFDQKESLAVKMILDDYEWEIDYHVDAHTSPPYAGENNLHYIYTVMRSDTPIKSNVLGEQSYFSALFNLEKNSSRSVFWKMSEFSTATNYTWLKRGIPSVSLEFVSENFGALGSESEMSKAYEWYGNAIMAVGETETEHKESTQIEITDTFNRADNENLGEVEIGGVNWIVAEGSGHKISNNSAMAKAQGMQITGFVAPSQNYEVSVDVEFRGTVGFAVRGKRDVNGYYRVSLGTSNTGIYTSEYEEISKVAFEPVIGQMYSLKVRCEDELIAIYIDDQLMLNGLITRGIKNRFVGLLGYNASETKIENFKLVTL